jgi:poly [ADP-ribose] polymerase 6/8
MKTDNQYIMLTQSPAREKIFHDFKKQFGSFFAFHGSALQNWHSILRTGIKKKNQLKIK